jgi:hypothetical protein
LHNLVGTFFDRWWEFSSKLILDVQLLMEASTKFLYNRSNYQIKSPTHPWVVLCKWASPVWSGPNPAGPRVDTVHGPYEAGLDWPNLEKSNSSHCWPPGAGPPRFERVCFFYKFRKSQKNLNFFRKILKFEK